MGAVAGEPTIASLAADYIKVRYQKPGSAFVGIVSRLDSFVSGVLVLARTSKAAARLTEQFKQRQSAKMYLACVEGTLEAPQWKTLSGFIVKNENAHRMQMVPANTRDAQSALLELRSLAHAANRSLIEINLLTAANIRSVHNCLILDIQSWVTQSMARQQIPPRYRPSLSAADDRSSYTSHSHDLRRQRATRVVFSSTKTNSADSTLESK